MRTSQYYQSNSQYQMQCGWVCDLCGNLIYGQPWISNDGMALCTNCQGRWDALNEGHTKDCISKFAVGNVF